MVRSLRLVVPLCLGLLVGSLVVASPAFAWNELLGVDASIRTMGPASPPEFISPIDMGFGWTCTKRSRTDQAYTVGLETSPKGLEKSTSANLLWNTAFSSTTTAPYAGIVIVEDYATWESVPATTGPPFAKVGAVDAPLSGWAAPRLLSAPGNRSWMTLTPSHRTVPQSRWGVMAFARLLVDGVITTRVRLISYVGDPTGILPVRSDQREEVVASRSPQGLRTMGMGGLVFVRELGGGDPAVLPSSIVKSVRGAMYSAETTVAYEVSRLYYGMFESELSSDLASSIGSASVAPTGYPNPSAGASGTPSGGVIEDALGDSSWLTNLLPEPFRSWVNGWVKSFSGLGASIQSSLWFLDPWHFFDDTRHS